jgi:hypothetical protein
MSHIVRLTPKIGRGRFCRKIWTGNVFFRKTISGLFLRNSPIHPFFGPNGLCGAFRGKIVMDENFSSFCLKCPQNHLSEKHVSGSKLFTKPPFTYFRGQMDNVARLGANCSGRQHRSLSPQMSPKSFFGKTRFRSEFFYNTVSSFIFGAKWTI